MFLTYFTQTKHDHGYEYYAIQVMLRHATYKKTTLQITKFLLSTRLFCADDSPRSISGGRKGEWNEAQGDSGQRWTTRWLGNTGLG